VPLDSKGMKARVEGVTKTRTLDKAEADHLVSEGATLTREAHGSAMEVSFIASGVELLRESWAVLAGCCAPPATRVTRASG